MCFFPFQKQPMDGTHEILGWKTGRADGSNLHPPDKAYLKMIFLFPRWDMLISWRVSQKTSPMWTVKLHNVAFNWLCFFWLISVVFWVWFLMLRPQSVEQFRGCTCAGKNSWNLGVPSIEDARWGAGSVMLSGLVPLIADDLIILLENESGQTIVTKPPVGHPKWWWKVRESFPKSPDHSGLAICQISMTRSESRTVTPLWRSQPPAAENAGAPPPAVPASGHRHAPAIRRRPRWKARFCGGNFPAKRVDLKIF